MEHATIDFVFNSSTTRAWSRGLQTGRASVVAAVALLGLWHAQAGAADLVAPCPPTSILAAPAPRVVAARAAAPRAARPRTVAAKPADGAARPALRTTVGQGTRPQAHGGSRAKAATTARPARRAATAPVAAPFPARPLQSVDNACLPVAAVAPMASMAPAAPSLAALIVGTPPSAPALQEPARIVPVWAQGSPGLAPWNALATLGDTDPLNDQGRESPGMNGTWPELLELPGSTETVAPGVPAAYEPPGAVEPQVVIPSDNTHDVPEPGSLALWLTGLLAAWHAKRRQTRRPSAC